MRPILTALLLLFLAASAAARDVKPDDFAYGIPLQTSGKDALFIFPVPTEVYKGVTRGDLGDICVFNGRGEVVPFSISDPDRPDPDPPEFRALTLFPLALGSESGGDRLSLQVRKGPGDSVISVETSAGKAAKREVSSYLLDASSLKRPVSALSLEWEPGPEGTVGRIRVEGSDDLERWTVLVPDASVLDLRYGEHVLSRRSIEMTSSAMKYYRISSATTEGMPRLSAVTARLARGEPELPREWSKVVASPSEKGTYDYLFELPGRMPVDRARVRLPQENTLVRATFFSRDSDGDPWRADGAALAYRLRVRGEEVTGPDIVLSASTARYRMMRIDPGGGGLGSGIPVIEFGWVPERILFVARGGGPFLLAYAAARPGRCPRNGDELFSRLTDQKGRRYNAEPAVTGPPVTLGGKAALQRPLLPEDPRTAILWTVLILAVAFLAWMAYRLHGQMENKGDRGGNDSSGRGEGDQT